MSVTFASASTLSKKEKEKFSFFGGHHPSTLKPADLSMMRIERERSMKRRGPLDEKHQQSDANVYQDNGDGRDTSLRTTPPALSLYAIEHGQKRRRHLTFEDLSAKQQLDIIEQTHGELLKELRKKRRCAYCHEIFSEMYNVNLRKCVWHPGKSVRGRWSCCNQPDDMISDMTQRQSGCSACDHSDHLYDAFGRERITLPVCIAMLIESWASPGGGGLGTQRLQSQRSDTQTESILNRTCTIERATSERVTHPKLYRSPPARSMLPANDMEALKNHVEMGSTTNIPTQTVYVNALVGHVTSALRGW